MPSGTGGELIEYVARFDHGLRSCRVASADAQQDGGGPRPAAAADLQPLARLIASGQMGVPRVILPQSHVARPSPDSPAAPRVSTHRSRVCRPSQADGIRAADRRNTSDTMTAQLR